MSNDSMVRALLHFAGDVLSNNFIEDIEVREKVVQMMIERGDVFSVTDSKYQLESLLRESSGHDFVEEDRAAVTLNVGLTPQDRTIVETANPDVTIRWPEAPMMPHGKAYAFRICDTNRMFADVPPDTKEVIDIGGNWTYYAADKNYPFTVHCCNLVDGWRELHRQTQRVVSAESGKPMTDYCTAGVQTCNHIALWFTSTHTLPCIDPTLWPGIFRRHMFEGGEAIFHYDKNMDTLATSGYIEDVDMHWVDEKGLVQFHFEGDSSLPYEHSRAWLAIYGKPNYFTDDGWDKVIHYRILSTGGGCIHARFELLDKATVGVVPSRSWIRWIGGEDMVVLPVPVFDETRGLAVSNPNAYSVVNVQVQSGMYEFVFGRGMTNDTMRPDVPLSRVDILGAVRAYNHSVKWNGRAIGATERLDAKSVDLVATGIYLAVVFRAARNRIVLSTLTDEMLRLQRRWGAKDVVRLIGKCVSYTALSPFLMLAKTVQESVDLVSTHLRLVGATGLRVTAATPVVPYVVLQPSNDVEGHALPARLGGVRSDDSDDTERKKAFYEFYRDEMPMDIRQVLEDELYDGVPPVTVNESTPIGMGTAGIVPPEVGTDTVQTEDEESVEINSTIDELIDGGRETWMSDFRRLQDKLPDWAGQDAIELVEGTEQQVHQYARHAVLEYALYQLDLTINVEARTLEFLERHYVAGTVNESRVRDDNITKDIGAAFWIVKDNVIQGMDSGNATVRAVDAVTKKFLEVVRKDDQYKVGKTAINLVYTTVDLRISNGRKIARTALKALKTGLRIKGVSFELVDGIAGSGKTRFIMENFTLNDVFTTGPKGPRDDAADRAKKGQFKDYIKEVDSRFRTTDSATMWGLPIAKVLYGDEGLMEHSGAHFLKAHLSRATKVMVSGDSGQIRFIDRGSGYGRMGFVVNKYWSKVKHMNVTDRMPGDATLLCRQFYPEWRRPLIKTRNPIRRSMRLELNPDPDAQTYRVGRHYEHWLSILQGDKAIMVRRPGFEDGKAASAAGHGETHDTRPVMTTHEAQGTTFPMTVAVRLNKHSNTVFDSKPHLYVTFSRHTVRFVYKSIAAESGDRLAQYVRQAMSFTEEEIDAVMDVSPDWLREVRDKEAELILKVSGP